MSNTPNVSHSVCEECTKETLLQHFQIRRTLATGKTVVITDRWLCYPCFCGEIKKLKTAK